MSERSNPSRLISHIDWGDTKKHKEHIQLLAQKIGAFLNQPNFASQLCNAVEQIPNLPDEFVENFSFALKLSHVQEIVVALALTKSVSEPVVKIGCDYIYTKLLSVLRQPNMAKEKIPDTIVHELLYFITRDTRDFVERDEILEYFQKHYAATLSLMPVLSAKPNRADVQRNYKKENRGFDLVSDGMSLGADTNALMQQMMLGDPNVNSLNPALQYQQPDMDRDIAITLAELLDDFTFVNAANKNTKSNLIHGSLRNHLVNLLVQHMSSVPMPALAQKIVQAWAIDYALVLTAFQEYYAREHNALPVILELIQELKVLRPVLDACALSGFAIDLAALASASEFLNLSKWLLEMVEKYGDQFTSRAIAFLKDRIIQQQQLPSVISNQGKQEHQPQPKFVVLTYETVQIFMELFKSISAEGKMSQPVQEELHTLTTTLESEIFPSDIEKEANDIFSRIYDGLMPIEEIINLLQLLKISNNLRERKIFQCIIRSFYEEYPHIPKYPEKELQITGILFGSLIQNQLVSYVPLVIALRYVLEALKQPISTNLFKFGFYALEQFIPRLPEWPQYCAHLRQVTHLQTVHPQLYQHIDAIFVASGMSAVNVQGPIPSGLVGGQNALAGLTGNENILNRQGFQQEIEHSLVGDDKLKERKNPMQLLSGGNPQSGLPQHGLSNPQRGVGGPPSGVGLPGQANPQALQQQQAQAQALAQQQAAQILAQQHQAAAQQAAAQKEDEFSGHALNISSLLSSQFKIVEPSEDVVDNIHFIFNNLSAGNLEAKSRELVQMLSTGEVHDYFAFYLVVKRASLEENYHELYCKLLFTMNMPKVIDKVRKQTCAAIRTLIESGRTKVSTSEKELLLSLANWIGLLTIARDIPLRHTHLPLKDCLLTAFETGSMISIVPFVSRVIRLTKRSRLFKPPNPWTVAILRVLAEIHNFPHVVDPIKFEIEILCGVLEMKIEDIVPSELLKARVKYVGPGVITDFETVAETPKDASKFTMTYLNINPSLALFRRQPHLKKSVFLCINNAIRESIQPVIDRLVTIASVTTREMVLKDFAMDADETKMMQAAAAMVQSLAGNLAAVTCKDNLRVAITNNLRTTLGGGPQQKNIPAPVEQAIHTVVQDNIEIACAVVQKVAAESAIQLMEEQLQEAVTARKQHREKSGRRTPYYDINYVGGHGFALTAMLPDFLKTNLGGVTPEQLQVYKYFLVSPQAPNLSLPKNGEYYDATNPNESHVTMESLSDIQYDDTKATVSTTAFLQQHLGELEGAGVAGNPLASSAGAYNINAAYGMAQPDLAAFSSAQAQSLLVAQQSGLTPEQQLSLQQIQQLQLAQQQQHAAQQHSDLTNSQGILQLSLEQAAKKMDLFVIELGSILNTLTNISSLSELTTDHPVVQMFSLVGSIIMCTPYKNEIIAYSIQIVLPKLFEPSLLHREAFLTVIDVLVNTLPSARKFITDLLLRSDHVHKFHHEVVPALLHYTLLSLPDYDANLSQLILEGDMAAIDFATYLYQDVIKASVLNPADLVLTLEALKLKVLPHDQSLVTLIENIRILQQQQQQQQQTMLLMQQQQHDTSLITNRKACLDYQVSAQSPKNQVAPQHQQLCARVYAEWLSGVGNEKQFIQHLQQYGLFGVMVKGGNELEMGFYQTLVELAVTQYHQALQAQAEQVATDHPLSECCGGIDAVVKLFHLLIQYSPDKLAITRALLSRVIYSLHQAHAAGTSFDQRPYLRFFVGLLKQHHLPVDAPMDTQYMLLLLEFRDAFHFLRPSVYPGFACAWLELVSHRTFMPKILADLVGWPFLAELLIDFFSFVAPWLKEAQMSPVIHLLYQGILRVLLVLLHDFPEFLCDYHYNFCDVIPLTCIQMRNLILSAFPHSMKLPDPFIPNLKLDLLPEIKDPPRIKSDYYAASQKVGLIVPLDSFIKTGKPVTFLPELLHILKTSGDDESYNVAAINSVVLYIGTRAIAEVAYQRGELSPLVPMEIFRYLTFNFDNEGRYLLFNAIANQLRYPNNHTYYFSCVLLFLFAEAPQEIIQEQITRILVERLIVHRPHPWGLLVTFVELVKNQGYNFWGRSFTRCAPEIERLFIQVGTHIAQHKGVP